LGKKAADDHGKGQNDDDLDIAQQAEARQVLSSILDYWNGVGINQPEGAPAETPPADVDGADGTSMANLLLAIAYLEFYLDNTPRSLELLINGRDALTNADSLGLEGDELMETIENVTSQIAASVAYLR